MEIRMMGRSQEKHSPEWRFFGHPGAAVLAPKQGGHPKLGPVDAARFPLGDVANWSLTSFLILRNFGIPNPEHEKAFLRVNRYHMASI